MGATGAVLESPHVAEKKTRGGARPGAGRPKTSQRDDVVVRMAADIVTHARYVADRRKISLAEYLDGFRAAVMKDFRDESARAAGGN
jgi:hypothetical protein